ncbi:Type 1 glutamine amidotransferase-like domain-containing protein [Spirosoma flavum]|uniref:Type 1 glutamine amidotransferase-like domain-containing protein n=1 Tax=Spirosoma flavum TaxID=2048557 RepID=A0ABW6ART5_9BACT
MNRREFVQSAGSSALLTSASLVRPPLSSQDSKRKIFIYGGNFTPRFNRYVALLTGKENPKVCFMPTASGDSLSTIVSWFEACANLPLRPYVQRSFISSYNQKESFENVLTNMDAIIVGGGNTLNMMAIWKVQGIDQILKNAWEKGIVLAGGSAGSLCWFEHGTTDSRPTELTKVEGLGFLKGSHCPHYHAEPQRKPLYWAKVKSKEYKPGYACDDRAGIYFEDNEVKEVVALDETSNAYYVSEEAGEIKERQLPKEILKA